LSTPLDIDLDNAALLRTVLFHLQIHDTLKVWENVQRQLVEARPEDPVAKRDLAAVLIEQIKSEPDSSEKKKKCIEEAIDLLNNVIKGKWDVRFDQIQVIALSDLSKILATSKDMNNFHSIQALVDSRLIVDKMPVDIRIVIQWSTPNTNIELHVTEPTKERCYSFNNKTSIGGMLSRDSNHIGPVEYVIKNAPVGNYKVEAALCHGVQTRLPCYALVQIWTHYATPLENSTKAILRFTKASETINVCTLSTTTFL